MVERGSKLLRINLLRIMSFVDLWLDLNDNSRYFAIYFEVHICQATNLAETGRRAGKTSSASNIGVGYLLCATTIFVASVCSDSAETIYAEYYNPSTTSACRTGNGLQTTVSY